MGKKMSKKFRTGDVVEWKVHDEVQRGTVFEKCGIFDNCLIVKEADGRVIHALDDELTKVESEERDGMNEFKPGDYVVDHNGFHSFIMKRCTAGFADCWEVKLKDGRGVTHRRYYNLEKVYPGQEDDDSNELAEYKQKVRAVASKLALENDWCDVVDKALKNELDIPEGLTKTKIRAVFEFEVDEEEYYLGSPEETVIDFIYSQDREELKDILMSVEVIRE